jgi:transcription antitermination factor NusG
MTASANPLILHSPPRWYATYTAPRHEKAVLAHLEGRSVESFLPLYNSTRFWNGRRAVVQMPLFPGYLFVRIPTEERLRVLEVPGVLSIVSSQGRLVPLPDEEVDALRSALETRPSEPHPLLSRGKRVRIKSGPLRGLKGVIVRRTHKLRMVVSVDCIKQSFAVELEASDLENETEPLRA